MLILALSAVFFTQAVFQSEQKYPRIFLKLASTTAFVELLGHFARTQKKHFVKTQGSNYYNELARICIHILSRMQSRVSCFIRSLC